MSVASSLTPIPPAILAETKRACEGVAITALGLFYSV
jgi:hypothetical protein